MKTIKNTPALMTVICNIQSMKTKIDPNYNRFADFKNLEKLNDEKLYQLHEQLIPEYNKTFNQ